MFPKSGIKSEAHIKTLLKLTIQPVELYKIKLKTKIYQHFKGYTWLCL